MKNKDCELVRDLLPSYIDNLTSDETNEFIELHIKNCPECKACLDELQKTASTDEKEKSTKFVKFAKKNQRKMRILKSIVFLVLAVILVNYVRNVVIYLNIIKKNKESLSCTNYHYQSYRYHKNRLLVDDYYVKDNKYMAIRNGVDMEDNERHFNYKYIDYYDGTTYYQYNIDSVSGIKFYTSREGTMEDTFFPFENDYEFLTLNPFLASIGDRITNTKCNNKDCYKLDFKLNNTYSRAIFIDKNTGLLVRDLIHSLSTDIPGATDGVYDYYINLNVVTDDDLKVPNVEEYKPINEVHKDLEKAWFDYYVEQGEEIPENLQYLLEEK